MSARILVVRVGQSPDVEEFAIGEDGDSLKAMQTIVGGYIEAVGIGMTNVAIFCDEDGVSKGLQHNSCGFLGDYFFAANNDEGETRSLTDDEMISCYAYWLENREVFHPTVIG